MPDPFSIVALSLTFLNGCIKGLIIISKAKHYKKDTSSVTLQVELVQHSLFTWAEEAGLMQDPPDLLISADKAKLVPKILRELSSLLTDLDKLKSRYSLHLQPTAQDAIDDIDDITTPNGKKRKELREKAEATKVQKRTQDRPWKKLRWITFDNKRMRELLEDVESYTSKLERLLDQSKQAARDRQLELIYRDLVLKSETLKELQVFGEGTSSASTNIAVAAAARLKHTRIQLGLSEASTSFDQNNSAVTNGDANGVHALHRRSRSSQGPQTIQHVRPMKLSASSLMLTKKAVVCPRRALTTYDNKAVLVEWKYVEGFEVQSLEERVNQVANFLHELKPCFHSLPCHGYIIDHVARRYGYIFDLPDEHCKYTEERPIEASEPILPEMMTLHDAFHCIEQPTPPLNERFSIAMMLIEGLLNVHTAGWVHKELRSENIIFIQRYPSDHDSSESQIMLGQFKLYIAGHVFSRVDRPGEMTEPLPSEADSDLYRHSDLLKSSRKPFCKAFDLFSVGCTLLEIGLWSALPEILKASVQPLKRRKDYRPIRVDTMMSDETFVDDDANDSVNQRSVQPLTTPLDLMELRYEMLLSYIGSSKNTKSCGPILDALRAATGQAYTNLVVDFLSAGLDGVQDPKSKELDEHEYALGVEISARDSLQRILKVI